MTKPTCDEIWNEELKQVERNVDDGWRHGVYVSEVYYRTSDNTYWNASYQRSTDGETNGLREGDADISQVEPFTYTAKGYRNVTAEPVPAIPVG